MHWETCKWDNHSTVDGECKVSEVQASTTAPMPNYKGFKQQ